MLVGAEKKVEAERGSERELGSKGVEGEAKRNSDAAQMKTIGCRHRVPDVEGRSSRRERVCMARETRKESGAWVAGIGRMRDS